MSPGSTVAVGQSRSARAVGIAACTPKRRASYVAEVTTPRLPAPPTITGVPASSGRRRTSTLAKNASMSTCSTVQPAARDDDPDDTRPSPLLERVFDRWEDASPRTTPGAPRRGVV